MKRMMDKKAKNNRNVGIDLLRIISTYSIILLHIMGHGGIRNSLNPGNVNYYVLWFMMVTFFCGVNCFGLISGYVGYSDIEKPNKSSRFIRLWFQVVFYCITTVIGFKLLNNPDIGLRDFIEAFFPITFERYWYFSAYFGVFIIMPFINKCVREFSDSYLIKITVIGVLAFSFLATIITRYSDPFSLNGGYGFVWLSFLYFIGAIIKKLKFASKVSNKFLVRIILICLITTWLWKVVLISVVGHGIDDLLVIYISPTILLMSVCMLTLFSKFHFNRFVSGFVSFAAPATFGVYLFQDSDYLRKYFITGRYAPLAFENPVTLIALILGIGFIQFLIGLIIDKGRSVLFDAIRINGLANQIGKLIDNILYKSNLFAEKYLNPLE